MFGTEDVGFKELNSKKKNKKSSKEISGTEDVGFSIVEEDVNTNENKLNLHTDL